MEPYSRLLLHFIYAVSHPRSADPGVSRVESFAFGTSLTRLTQELAERDVDRALQDRRPSHRGLGRRHPHRRCVARVQLHLEPAAPWPGRGGAHHQRRLGPRRYRPPPPRDGAPPPELPSPDLAQPAAGVTGLPTADPGHRGGAAPRRRLSAGPQPGESGAGVVDREGDGGCGFGAGSKRRGVVWSLSSLRHRE